MEIIIPVVSAGVFLPGFFLFGYLLRRVPDRVYSRTLVFMSIGFLYVLGEALVVVIGGVAHRFAPAVQISRLEQLVVLWMIPVIPYYLGGVLTTPSSFPGANRAMVAIGVAISAVITVVAFVSPDLFRSVTNMHSLATQVESTYGRGAGGPLTNVRNIGLLVMIIYGNVLIVLEMISYRKTRFSITLIVGSALALASMVAASWRFVDESREVELAHAESKQHQNRLSYLAYHDQLTGARNRKAFYEVLANRSQPAASGAADGFALFYIDLDHFKQVNDTYGHRTGDLVLRSVAETLKAGIRQSDELFRIGGDEFALIVDTPTHSTTVEELVAKADLALYHAKQERNSFQLYHSGMDGGISDSAEVHDVLREAVESGTIALAYQPIFTRGNEIEGYEALLRWQPPFGRAIPIERVIELASTTGLVRRLGELIVNRAVSDVAPLIASGRISYVSINVVPRELATRSYPEMIHSIARKNGVSLEQIRLEMPERGIIASLPAGGAQLVAAANEGLRFVIDEFGKGYSSLSYLGHLPINTVKLDRSLIADLTHNRETTALVRGVVTMTTDLGMETVAVGVETQEQLDFLKKLGCSRFQGFFLGRPGPLP